MFNRVIRILEAFTEVEIEKMNKDSKLVADLGLNSFDVVNIVVEFEDEFGIEIPDEDIKEFQTIQNVLDYLQTHV